jgi:4-amino-4-deoxy-L-arabinose transferase-like glycosyltransferase
VVLDQWPRPLLSSYGAWSGPTVYWLLAGLSSPFGGSMEAVRLVVALFSWGACAIAYVLFRDRLHARPLDALALALLLAVSPFFFGQSFLVLTDNPTWFFVVLALERALAYVERPALTRIAAFAVCLALATTMRQISVWLLLPGLLAVLSAPESRRRKAVAVGLLGLGLIPLVGLLLYWGGPLPPDPVSGGAAATPLAAGYRVRNLLLTLGVVGFYALLLLPAAELRDWWKRVRRRPSWLLVLAAPALIALAMVVVGALGTITSFLTLVSRVPFVLFEGASLLFWLLVPLGAAAVAGLLSTRLADVRSRVLAGALVGLLLSAMANRVWYERYVDFPALLLLAGLGVAAGVALGRVDRERWLLTGLASIAAFLWLR